MMAEQTRRQVLVRMPPELVRRIDRAGAAMRRASGHPVSRNDAILALLTRALDVPDPRR
jgi:hypothetical protein